MKNQIIPADLINQSLRPLLETNDARRVAMLFKHILRLNINSAEKHRLQAAAVQAMLLQLDYDKRDVFSGTIAGILSALKSHAVRRKSPESAFIDALLELGDVNADLAEYIIEKLPLNLGISTQDIYEAVASYAEAGRVVQYLNQALYLAGHSQIHQSPYEAAYAPSESVTALETIVGIIMSRLDNDPDFYADFSELYAQDSLEIQTKLQAEAETFPWLGDLISTLDSIWEARQTDIEEHGDRTDQLLTGPKRRGKKPAQKAYEEPDRSYWVNQDAAAKIDPEYADLRSILGDGTLNIEGGMPQNES
jgi:hypothetical protein